MISAHLLVLADTQHSIEVGIDLGHGNGELYIVQLSLPMVWVCMLNKKHQWCFTHTPLIFLDPGVTDVLLQGSSRSSRFHGCWAQSKARNKANCIIYVIDRDRFIIYLFNPLGIFGLMPSFCFCHGLWWSCDDHALKGPAWCSLQFEIFAMKTTRHIIHHTPCSYSTP